MTKYTICYMSPNYYLYNETTNELIMKDYDRSKVLKKKKELENERD